MNTEFTSCDCARNTFTACIRIHPHYVSLYFILILKSFHNSTCQEHCFPYHYVHFMTFAMFLILLYFFSFPLSQGINSHTHQTLILKIIYYNKAIKSEVQCTSYVHCTHSFFYVLESPTNTMNHWKIFQASISDATGNHKLFPLTPPLLFIT